MIKKLFIIAASSANLFTYAPLETKRNEIQDQLITGFITANVSFSEAIMGKGLNRIDVGGDLLIFYKEKTGLTIAAIVDSRDNSKLLRKVMDEILLNFHMLFKDELKNQNIEFSKDKSRDFKFLIDDLCSNYITSREKWKSVLGVTIGVLVSLFMGFLFYGPLWQLFNTLLIIIDTGTLQNSVITFGIVVLLTQLLLIASLVPGSLLSGIITADRKNGRFASIIQYGCLLFLEYILYLSNPFYLYLDSTVVSYYLFILLVFVLTTLLTLVFIGEFGGYIMTRIKLYPLEELKMKAHDYIGLKADIF